MRAPHVLHVRERSRLPTRTWMDWTVAYVLGEARTHPLRTAVAVAAIATGVALGYAVDMINRAALMELSSSVNSLTGSADLEIRGPRTGFDEELYPAVARLPEVAVASPVVEVDARVVGRNGSLKLLGIDVFRAQHVTPNLAGRVADDSRGRLNLLDPEVVFLSPAASNWAGAQPGERIMVQVGLQNLALRVAGTLPGVSQSIRIGVLDIAAAQWHLHRIGTLQRIDVKLKPGVDVELFKRSLSAVLPAGVAAITPLDNVDRASLPSRAYRANLNVLAMIALFTGTFLVFTVEALSVVQRRAQFALLRALGVRRRGVLGLVVAESAMLGASGALIGLALGYALAAAVLHFAGADLGGGYFDGMQPSAHFDATSFALFFALGLLSAVLGGIVLAWEAAHACPAQALKATDEETSLERLCTPMTLACAIGALTVGLLSTQMPPVDGIPKFAYAAIALLLIGGILATPFVTKVTLNAMPRPRCAVPQLALAQITHSPGRSAIGLSSIVASFSMMAAMIIMVSSFRVAVDDWLQAMLPAPIYLRVSTVNGGDSAYLSEKDQAMIAMTPGIRRVEFQRSTQILINERLPSVSLLVRPVDPFNPGAQLPLTGASIATTDGDPPPVWISEAMAGLYDLRLGQKVEFPLAGRHVMFTVAGIWRDYVRQFGVMVIRERDYRRLTHDSRVTDAALWPDPGITSAQLISRLRTRVQGRNQLEFSEPGEIRATGMRIFDRSFAVTYLLEAVAVFIAIFGIGTSFNAQALARIREFGVLRHLGIRRREIAAMLAFEGATLAILGVLIGLSLGWVIAMVLVYVINPQSFHWTMDLIMPWKLLAALASLVVFATALTAAWCARNAMSIDAITAVHEDW